MSKWKGRPESDVSSVTGYVGALSLTIMLLVILVSDVALPAAVFLLLLGTAVPMVVWDLAVGRVYRRASTGLDFSLKHSAADLRPVVVTKLLGLLATWTLLGLAYFSIRSYASKEFDFYFALLDLVLPFLIILAPPYIWWTSRHMVDPKDGLWHVGKLACLQKDQVDKAKVIDHLRAWAVKGFFLALMISFCPNIVASVIHFDLSTVFDEPGAFALFLIRLLFLYDICFGTIGYVLTLRPLDSHIRSANPFLGGWAAVLVCYPPMILMGPGGPLDYRNGGQAWTAWFDGMDGLLIIWGTAIVMLTFIYAWATVIFGIRFSNLTHRGIITNGPYRYFQHPAYFSKNVFWWLAHLPFLSTVDTTTALQNCTLLLVVNGIYYLRAKTEEHHLSGDPHYREYAAWIAENGILPRAKMRIGRCLDALQKRPTPTSGV